MMPGVAAQPLVRRFSGGIDPADILADFDFLAETYAVHGASAVAADVIDKPARVGASGLEILDNDADGVVSAIGTFLTDLETMNWTIYIEWEELTTDGATYLLYLLDVDNDHSFLIERSTAFTGLRVDVREGSFNSRDIEIDTSHGPGVHKIVVTRTDAFVSMSCDGSDVATLVAAPISMNPMTKALFGGDWEESFNGCFIRKIKLMTPQNDAFLPALSA